jgi:hypothetical protein
MPFVVGCKKTFQNFIKNIPKKLRSNYHHVPVKEWDDFIAKIPVRVVVSMKEDNGIKPEENKTKESCRKCD